MDFDISRISVPFRMQPDLRRLPADDVFAHRLEPATPLHTTKASVVAAGEAFHCVQGFDGRPALDVLSRLVRASDPNAVMDDSAGQKDRALAMALAIEEDFAVLDLDSGRVPLLCVCVPSRWAPEDKLGQSLLDIHAPVADNLRLLAATQSILGLLRTGQSWERHVWTISPSASYDLHPRRMPAPTWPDAADPAEFAARCHLRVEQQTLVPAGHQCLFMIRVMLTPLTQAVRGADDARHLRNALRSMSDAVLAYKNLGVAREPLCRWLDSRADN